MQGASQRAGADGCVVADEVEFGLAPGREEAFLGVRDDAVTGCRSRASPVVRAPLGLRQQLDEIAGLNDELAPFRILTGIEVDILADGALDQTDELLGALDVVVASAHSKLRMEPPEMTARLVAAVESPHTDVLGHCTGRLIVGRGRPPSTFDPDAVFEACARTGTAVEINSRPERRDPPPELLDQAVEHGCLFSIDRGELRRELARCLRSGQVRRRHNHVRPAGVLPDMVTLSQRPAEVDDRAVPGHWEGDLICGSNNRSAVGTLVERQTRYVMLLHLPNSHEAVEVQRAMEKAIASMPAELFRTLTWDRGKEMARHKEIKVATGVQVYFCDPHSPWQV